MNEKLLSISEAAKLLEVCENTLRDWDIEGKFKAERTAGGHRRYSLSQIRKYLDENPPKDNPNPFSKALPPPSQHKEIVKFWQEAGYLEDMDDQEQMVMAIILENTRLMWMICQNPVLSSNQAIWLTHQGWLRSRLRKIVAVQPLLGPCGLIYFMEHKERYVFVSTEAALARTYKYDFGIFKNANFETVKEAYADALAMNIDNHIFDQIQKVELGTLQELMQKGDGTLKEKGDYVIVPKDQEEDFQGQGVDVYGLPTILDPNTFNVLAAIGRYPTSYLSPPVFAPYTMIIEGVAGRSSVESLMFRSGWLDNPDAKG